jgi:alkylated DNA repair dioxygenase AlkB
MNRTYESHDGKAYLDKCIFENIHLLERCILAVDPLLEERPPIMIYGKVCHQKRNVGFFSNQSVGYEYSRKLMASKPLDSSMDELLSYVNYIMKTDFNGILVNKYIDGMDYISAHSDDEKGLYTVGVVAISYGAERIFRIRDKINKKVVINEITTHGSIIIMGGDFQKYYTHEIPVQKKVTQPRWSLTFRKHNK